MKRNILWVGLISLTLCFSITSLTGCAKKVTLKEGAVAAQEESAVAQGATEEAAPAVTQSDSTFRQKSAVREQAASGATATTDKAAMDDMAAREAAERARLEADQKLAAMLKELQIANINFDFDKYNLKPEAQEILKAGAPAYLKYRDYKLVVEGHCDERGTDEYNLALGEKRSMEAANYLIDLGIDKDRIKIISYGEEMPLDNGQNEEAWTKNRRAQFVIVPPTK